MGKKVIPLIIVALLIGGVGGYYIAVPRLKSEISTLTASYTQLNETYSELLSDHTTLKKNIDELELLLNTEILDINFSPNGGAASKVINWIDQANETIHVLIYSFTNDDIGEAIVKAHQRGVEIKVVFEKSQVSQYSEYIKLRTAGILVKNDTNSGLMHHKVAIVDGYIVLTGSFNWSASAEERNNENLIVIKSDYLATVFEKEFKNIWNTSI